MKKDFLGRGWRFPFGFDASTGRVAMSEAEENIRTSISLILGTRPGERQMLPAFGCRVHELMYTPNTAANASLVTYHVRTALERWEPRIDVVDVAAEPSPDGRMRVAVRYRVKATLAEQLFHVDLHTGG